MQNTKKKRARYDVSNYTLFNPLLCPYIHPGRGVDKTSLNIFRAHSQTTLMNKGGGSTNFNIESKAKVMRRIFLLF